MDGRKDNPARPRIHYKKCCPVQQGVPTQCPLCLVTEIPVANEVATSYLGQEGGNLGLLEDVQVKMDRGKYSEYSRAGRNDFLTICI
jgi:hypothetical protein